MCVFIDVEIENFVEHSVFNYRQQSVVSVYFAGTTPRMKSREAPPVPCASPATGRDMGGESCNSEPTTGDISNNKRGPGQESAPTQTPPPSPPSDHPSCPVSPAVAMDTVPPNIAMKMVEEVRRNTQLSYELSHTAVATVLNQLKDNVPCLSQVMTNILHTLIQHKVSLSVHSHRQIQTIYFTLTHLNYR